MLVHCCWCKRGCATGDHTVEADQVVFCMFCAAMQLVIESPWGSLITRPLTIDELDTQLRDAETMRILGEVFHA